MTAATRRAKRVTDVLDERVLARLRGDEVPDHGGSSASSGSDHEGASPALSTLLDGFFSEITDGGDDDPSPHDRADNGLVDGSDEEGSDCDRARKAALFSSRRPFPSAAMVRDLMRPSPADRLLAGLISDVAAAARRHEKLRPGGAAFRRAVMGALREAGHNAGICKSRWDRGGGLAAGAFEYIDVVVQGAAEQRWIVDLGFAAEFEIARPTAEYEEVRLALPEVYVGRAEELRRAVRVLAEEARRSMAARGLHVPPWRKLRYLQAKWLGPYKRTTNAVPSRTSPSAPAASAAQQLAVPGPSACRAVGFQPVRTLIPPAA